MTQPHRTQNQKPMRIENWSLSFESKELARLFFYFFFFKFFATRSQTHLENTHVDYSRKGIFRVSLPSYLPSTSLRSIFTQC